MKHVGKNEKNHKHPTNQKFTVIFLSIWQLNQIIKGIWIYVIKPINKYT